jgi:hypothetical protein
MAKKHEAEGKVHGNDYERTMSVGTKMPLKEERRRMQQETIAGGRVKGWWMQWQRRRQ